MRHTFPPDDYNSASRSRLITQIINNNKLTVLFKFLISKFFKLKEGFYIEAFCQDTEESSVFPVKS